MTRVVLALGVLWVAASSARADVGRYALIIGANRGQADEAVLRYAGSDGQRLSRILRTIGQFSPEDIVVLDDVAADDVRRGLAALNARILRSGGDAVVLVFYSGHADAENLHLGKTRLPLTELRALVSSSPAIARVLIVDACRSGALTRVKGGSRAPSFDIRVDAAPGTEGTAILTSSAAGEDSQESDQLGGSVFTHYLASGLLGAADRDRDGRVTISEAFDYAAHRTLVATTSTLAGPQHPTYRKELAGREDLVLTRPGALHRDLGTLQFAAPGSYLVVRAAPPNLVVAEWTSDEAGGGLALEAGRYVVTRRDPDSLLQGAFMVAPGTPTTVRPEQMQRIDYAEVVRKGGTQRTSALSAFALAGARSGFLGLGTAWTATVGGRLDRARVALEWRGGVASANQTNPRLSITSRETAASIAGLRVFELGRPAVSLGVELGGFWLAQSFSVSTTAAQSSYGAFVGPVVQLEAPLAGRTYVRADAALLTYFLPSGGSMATANVVSFRATAGLGVYF